MVIGCRNHHELELLEQKGIKKVIGIDLFSYNQRIKVMDMHHLKFRNNAFDLVFLSHYLEHALKYTQVLSEFARVLRDGGIILIECPINFEPRGSDLHNFQSAENLLTIYATIGTITEILYKENVDKARNSSGTDVARVIFKITK